MICSYVMLTSRMRTVVRERKCGKDGGFTECHRSPMLDTMRISPTVATTLIVSLASSSDRASSSSTSPTSGANTNSEIAAAIGHGTPWSTWSR